MGMRKPQQRRRKKPEVMEGLRRASKHLEGVTSFDSQDHELLRKFMTERGKIMPRRVTGATAKQQRQNRSAIRRARLMGLLP